MKNFRPLCVAVVLTAAFAVPALADGGVLQGPGAPAPEDTQGPTSTEQGAVQGPGLAAPEDIQSPSVAAFMLALQGLFF